MNFHGKLLPINCRTPRKTVKREQMLTATSVAPRGRSTTAPSGAIALYRQARERSTKSQALYDPSEEYLRASCSQEEQSARTAGRTQPGDRPHLRAKADATVSAHHAVELGEG